VISKTLSHFEVLDRIGAGGMGEVYRARDTKLGREVALKLLPTAFARDPDRLARLDREARLLASVNHPGVAAIYGIDESDGLRFLVLELVPGVTLAERLAQGPLSTREVLRVVRRIAAGMAAAHAKGIIHRDLKPANVKLTPEGHVKVLDFGIAREIKEGAGPVSTAETIASPGTLGSTMSSGMILGTPAYMSPEQVRGRAADASSDIWAFGALFYELLTRRHAFLGETPADTIAAILGQTPDWGILPADVPEGARALLRRCLEKNASARPRDFQEVIALIDRATETVPTPARRAMPRLLQVTFSEELEEFPAWSPDGSKLAYAREVGSLRKIFRQDAAGGAPVPVTTGEFDDFSPAWAPDGRTMLFVRHQQHQRRHEPGDVFGENTNTDVWSVDVETGKEALLVRNASNPAWSPDGARIAVDARWAGPSRLWVLDSRGRNPKQASGDTSEEVVHVRPRWSPDGEHLVFQNIERTKFDIRVAHVASGRMVSVTNDPSIDVEPCWSPSGRHIYFSSYRSGGINLWRIPVRPDGSPGGPLEQMTTGAGQDVQAVLSPDGSRLAFTILRQNADLWKLPVSPETGQPTGAPEKVLATSREESRGAWSPDGSRIAFNSDRTGDMNIWVFSPRDGSARALTHGPGGDYQPNWSPDGRTVAFFSSRGGEPAIWTVDVESGDLRCLSREGAIEINPFYSPDGRWIAFMSDREGRLELWVMRSDGGEPSQVNREGVGGHFLRWSKEGAIIFRCPARKALLRVSPEGGEPELFAEIAGGAHISLSPDETRVMDVVNHKTLWVSPVGGAPERVFEFDEPAARIDYPVWSPDGRWILFDRFQPQGGDIWVMENFDS